MRKVGALPKMWLAMRTMRVGDTVVKVSGIIFAVNKQKIVLFGC